MMDKSKSGVRNANIELLRIISMLMVVTLHTLSKGGLLKDLFAGGADYVGPNAWIAWLLESLCIVGVNVFMLISGYFLVDGRFKSGRFLELICEIMFYAILGTVLAIATGMVNPAELTTYDYLFAILPIHMSEYWFMTAYVILYMLSPVISAGIKKITQGQLKAVIIMLLVYECVFKSVLPLGLEGDDKGYSVLWLLTIFLIAGYIRLYGCKPSWKGGRIYLVSSILILLEEAGLQFVYIRTGRLEIIQEICYHYNHILPVVASVGLFLWALNRKPMGEKPGAVVIRAATVTLGVYLCHEQVLIRYNWPKLLNVPSLVGSNSLVFLLGTVGSTLIVFIVCGIIDLIRQLLFKAVKKTFASGQIVQKMKDFDQYMFQS